MKIEVESEALDSLKAMAQQLQDERDELLEALSNIILRGVRRNHGGSVSYEILPECEQHANETIAKCTKKPEVM